MTMLKNILLAILAMGMAKSSAQEWFPNDAQWYYHQVILFQGDSYQYFEVLGDTVLQGKSGKIVKGVCEGSAFGIKNVLYQEGNLVYVFDADENSFVLLYNFDLEAGDTLVYHDNSFIHNGSFIIDSISTVQAGSLTLRIQHISWLDGSLQLGTKIYERIGANGCLYPVSSVFDPATGGLRCYEDSLTGLINFQEPPLSCDYISDVHDPKVQAKIKVFPNPANDVIHVDSELTLKNICLFDCLGKKVYENDLSGAQHAELEVTDLTRSMYYIRIITLNGEAVVKSFVLN